MSSDCVDSVLDNLPAVAEDDEEIDVDEVVADIYKCLDDVIEADETEENQRSSQKIDEESATNDTPSDECEYKVCGEGDLEIAHGTILFSHHIDGSACCLELLIWFLIVFPLKQINYSSQSWFNCPN